MEMNDNFNSKLDDHTRNEIVFRNSERTVRLMSAFFEVDDNSKLYELFDLTAIILFVLIIALVLSYDTLEADTDLNYYCPSSSDNALYWCDIYKKSNYSISHYKRCEKYKLLARFCGVEIDDNYFHVNLNITGSDHDDAGYTYHDDAPSYHTTSQIAIRELMFHASAVYLLFTHIMNNLLKGLTIESNFDFKYLIPFMLLPAFSSYISVLEVRLYYELGYGFIISLVLYYIIVVYISIDSVRIVNSLKILLFEFRSHNVINAEVDSLLSAKFQDREVAIKKILLSRNNLTKLSNRLNLKLKLELIYTSTLLLISIIDVYFVSNGQSIRWSISATLLCSCQLFFVSMLQVTTFQDELTLIESENKVSLNFKVNFFGFKVNSTLLISLMFTNVTGVAVLFYNKVRYQEL